MFDRPPLNRSGRLPAAGPSSTTLEAREQLERFLRIRLAEAAGSPRRKSSASITLSRQVGLGGRHFAIRLARYLDNLDGLSSGSGCGWAWADATTLDTLMAHFAGRSNSRIISFPGGGPDLPGTEAASVSPAATAIRQFCCLGNAIMLGRGGHCPDAAGDLPNVFRVRLIADLEDRVQRFAERAGILDLQRAEADMRNIDASRRNYVKRHFHSDLNDPLAFDLTLNLSQISTATAISLVADGLTEWFAAHRTGDR